MEPFDLYSPAIDADPFPYYEQLRENYPCYWSEGAQLWILSRYDDIVEAARDWQTFSSAQGNLIDELPGRAGATLGSTDPPRHDRLRALSQAAFLKRNLDALIEPALQIADRALDRIVEQKAFEFINDFSSQITVGLLFRTMGLPQRDHAEIRRKVILSVSTDKSAKGRTPAHIAAFKELSDFLTAEVAARRKNPTDDLITHLAEAEIDGDRLTEREIVLTTATFVMAGVESLSSFMSMFALNLHDYPDARRRVVADPALIAPAIEESLRFNTSAQRFKRTATRAVTLHGQTIGAGDKVALAFGSGNRDGRKFPDPDTLRYRPPAARPSRLRLRQAFLPRRADGAARDRSRHAALPRARARLSPHRRQVAWNSSSNFRSPAALPFAVRLTSVCSMSIWPSGRRKFVGAQLVRQLIEHGVDHAGLVGVDEGGGDVDIFGHDDPRRHVAPAGKFIGAGAQHRAQHRLDALERPAARQRRVDLRIEPALLAHHAADDVAKERGFRRPVLRALDLAAEPMALELGQDLVEPGAGEVHLIERLHGGKPRRAALVGLAGFGLVGRARHRSLPRQAGA